MRARSRKPRTTVLIAAVLCPALSLAAAAFGADQTDRTFGTDGIAEIPLPVEAQGAGTAIWDLANAPGAKMVAAIGNFSGYAYFAAARFSRNGSLDTSFGNGGFTEAIESSGPGAEVLTQAQAVAVQGDGKVVVAGYRQQDAGHTPALAPILVRYRSDGTLDPSFGRDGKVMPKFGAESPDPAHLEEGGGALHDVAIEASGRIVAIGARNEIGGGRPAGMVIAYRPNGGIDRDFGRAGRVFFSSIRDHRYTALRSIKVLPSGKLLVSGYLHSRLFLARLTADGKLDPSFGGGDGKVSIRVAGRYGCDGCRMPGSLGVDRRGRIIVLANRSLSLPVLARFLPDGSLDRSFGQRGLSVPHTAGSFGEGFGLALQKDSQIVVAGFEIGTTPTGHEKLVFAALRFLPNGRFDRSFGKEGLQAPAIGRESAALAALTQPSGRVVAGGLSVEGQSGHIGEASLLLTRYLPGAGG